MSVEEFLQGQLITSFVVGVVPLLWPLFPNLPDQNRLWRFGIGWNVTKPEMQRLGRNFSISPCVDYVYCHVEF
jgi:hypothetical protein